MTRLTESQRRRWERTRAKGRTRIIVEQFLAWTAVAAGGPTLRAYLRKGSEGAQAYWSGIAGVEHAFIAVLVGAVMAYILGAAAWQRMERLYHATSHDDAAEPLDHKDPRREGGP